MLCWNEQYVAIWGVCLTHCRLSHSAGRSRFISFLYFFKWVSRTKFSFITWSMYLQWAKTCNRFIYNGPNSNHANRGNSRHPYLSMVPNSHLGSLLKGIRISWKRANLVAISAEIVGLESCSVCIRIFWEIRNTENDVCKCSVWIRNYVK